MARIVDPDLIAQIVRQLNVQGPLAPFDIGQVAIPVFDIGKLSALDTPTEVVTPNRTNTVRIGLNTAGSALVTVTPTFSRDEVVVDTQNATTAPTVLADSGQLAADDWWVDCSISQNDGTTVDLSLQWRNAANNANILEIPFFGGLRVGKLFGFRNVLVNERFRLISNTNIAGIIHSYMATRQASVATAV